MIPGTGQWVLHHLVNALRNLNRMCRGVGQNKNPSFITGQWSCSHLQCTWRKSFPFVVAPLENTSYLPLTFWRLCRLQQSTCQSQGYALWHASATERERADLILEQPDHHSLVELWKLPIGQDMWKWRRASPAKGAAFQFNVLSLFKIWRSFTSKWG